MSVFMCILFTLYKQWKMSFEFSSILLTVERPKHLNTETEIRRLQTDGHLKLSVSPVYTVSGCIFKLSFLNARSTST